MKNNNNNNELGFSLVQVLVAVLVVGVVAGVGYYIGASQNTDKTQEKEIRVSDNGVNGDNLVEEEIAYYANDEIGIAFSYPVELGEVDVSFFDGVEEQGVRYELSFTNSKEFGPYLSGASNDFVPGGVLNFGQLGVDHANESVASSTQPYQTAAFEANLNGKLYSLDDGAIAESGFGNISERHYVFDISGRFNSVVVHGALRDRNLTTDEQLVIEQIALSLEEI